MQVPSDAFDDAQAGILERPQHLKMTASGNRVAAAVITITAHIVVVIALIAGINTARTVHSPAMTLVQIQPQAKREDQPRPAASVFSKPTVITAPIPDIQISPPAHAISAAPPADVPPSPPPSVASTAPADTAHSWQALLLAKLEQAKRYPALAQFHRQQGVVFLRFAMNRDGQVLSVAIDRSSGFAALDQEALALIQRAQPLPKPPPDVQGATINLVVPIEFYLNYRR